MKTIQLMMMTLMMCLITMVSFGQEKTNYLKDGIFHTTFESGIGEKIKMDFVIDSVNLVKIQETEIFKNWDSTTFSNPKNAVYIETCKSLSHVEMFLMGKTTMASFYAKFQLKNTNSYTPINGNPIIFCSSGKITIVFPMKAQNGYGNFILSKAFYSLEWVDGKEKSFNFISNN